MQECIKLPNNENLHLTITTIEDDLTALDAYELPWQQAVNSEWDYVEMGDDNGFSEVYLWVPKGKNHSALVSSEAL